jgi:hypothetical protein
MNAPVDIYKNACAKAPAFVRVKELAAVLSAEPLPNEPIHHARVHAVLVWRVLPFFAEGHELRMSRKHVSKRVLWAPIAYR